MAEETAMCLQYVDVLCIVVFVCWFSDGVQDVCFHFLSIGIL